MTVPLQPGGQAIVVTDAIVLMEGSPELDATVMGARTLCTVQSGKLLVEVGNASKKNVLLRKYMTVAVTFLETTVPSGVDSLPTNEESPAPISVLSATTNDKGNSSNATPKLKKVSKKELEVDFEGSKLSKGQQRLLKEVLERFHDMFVETSMTPGRTDLLEFSLDTGSSPPIKRSPCRVSKVEGDVMEAELQQYLSLVTYAPLRVPG
ncbi:LOW QUALITY PROTEIN: hypothetical protein PHMEG_0004698 [Phytophthora megakarya]|uniref:Uncharacterized protein n=1 Tax=Phytophthora megakarya TaxID=4795 RepID=A0A225WT72_9STRA|nr:LOW QUALITY PROTEIN: hypothetical protein PHMEG_0004698 [Phytophthora megakarya]